MSAEAGTEHRRQDAEYQHIQLEVVFDRLDCDRAEEQEDQDQKCGERSHEVGSKCLSRTSHRREIRSANGSIFAAAGRRGSRAEAWRSPATLTLILGAPVLNV